MHQEILCNYSYHLISIISKFTVGGITTSTVCNLVSPFQTFFFFCFFFKTIPVYYSVTGVNNISLHVYTDNEMYM